MLKNIYLIIFFLITLLRFSSAQFSAEFSLSSYVDDNVYSSPYAETDILSDYSAYLGYFYEENGVNFYYEADYTRYSELVYRNYWAHEFGINYSKAFGENEEHNLYLGGYFFKRIDTEENYYYDYSQLYGYSNFNFSFDNLFLKTGYNFRYRSYDEIPDLTNYRHYLFVQGNKSFKTRTSIIVEADIGYKSYAGVEVFDIAPGGGVRPPDGGDDSPGGGPHGGGHGRNMVESIETVTGSYTVETTSIPSMGQAVFLFRVAQSIFKRMGIYVQYRKQISLTPGTDYKNLDTQYVDEELFDDPFSYEGDFFSSKLSWMLPWQTKIGLGGGYASKNYLNEYAYISEEDTSGLGGLRFDDQTNVYLNITKNFYFKKTWIEMISIYLNFSFINNKSNSFWYDYDNKVYGAGLEFSF